MGRGSLIRRCLHALALILGLGPAAAETPSLWPQLYDVARVASDDVLNLRAGPGTDHSVIGGLAHDAKRVEVLGVEGAWARVSTGETTGWAALRFLDLRHPEITTLPRPMTCYGTEPFWSLTLDPVAKGARFTTPDNMAAPRVPMGWTARVDTAATWLLWYGDLSENTALITRGTCHDGMSDRSFGLTVTVLQRLAGDMYPLHGCCTLR